MTVSSALNGETLAARLGIKPLPDELLTRAFTHASYLNEVDEAADSNERLEFLGDAVLGMVVARYLFEKNLDADEGDLTKMRAEVVRGTTLARVARRYDLGDALILGKGEEAAGGRDRDRNLAGLVEAIMGAVFMAHGYTAARVFVTRVMRPDLDATIAEGPNIDPKSKLQHLVQARWHEPPAYVTVESNEGDSSRDFVVEVRAAGEVLAQGTGKSKREAQRQAAREAVSHLTAKRNAEG